MVIQFQNVVFHSPSSLRRRAALVEPYDWLFSFCGAILLAVQLLWSNMIGCSASVEQYYWLFSFSGAILLAVQLLWSNIIGCSASV